jgi:hypothetical protein
VRPRVRATVKNVAPPAVKAFENMSRAVIVNANDAPAVSDVATARWREDVDAQTAPGGGRGQTHLFLKNWHPLGSILSRGTPQCALRCKINGLLKWAAA